MVTSVRDFDEALLSHLKCPVCTAYMIPPISLCCNGHNICRKCTLKKIQRCPVCRGRLSGIRNITLETIARRQMYPCINRDKGCFQVFSVDLIADHEAVCPYGLMKCPMNKFPSVMCSWKGLISELKKHVTGSHKDYYSDTPDIRLHSIRIGEAVRFIWNEMFLCYESMKAGKWFCVVQMVGTKEEAANYKSQLTLFGSNGVEKIVGTFVVRSFLEDFSDSFQSGKCLVLDDTVIGKFIKGVKLNLTVSVSKSDKSESKSE
jgi:E3 ubiquitin-protein ligase SIAH1